jgi:phosphate acetyltransferase
MKIVFPEGTNQTILSAVERARDQQLCEPILLGGSESDLRTAMTMVTSGEADAVVAGIDYTSRDVILAARDIFGIRPGLKTFSSVFFVEFPDGRIYAVSDGATCKHPSTDQLIDIIEATAISATKVIGDIRIAVLSFSTYGSGGHDSTIDTTREAVAAIRQRHPELVIDGEMQLDAAINPAICAKKAPSSVIAGRANVLICPDINSGNILYKAMQQFGGAKAYGPILQGFNYPVSDLSRGSTADDVLGVIRTVSML